MDKGELFIIILVGLAIGILFLFVVTEINEQTILKDKCATDCQSFGLAMFNFKYDNGLYQEKQTECWCKNEKESKRIW